MLGKRKLEDDGVETKGEPKKVAGSVEYEIVGIVKEKLIFKDRPRPIVSASSLKQ